MAENAGTDGWIEKMFSMAIANRKFGELKHAFDNITFINFNYGRCLEHYIYRSLQRISVPEQDARQIVDRLSVIRPDGTLGSIWQGERGSLPFGYGGTIDALDASQRIRTFTESEALHDGDHLQRAMSEAKMYIFLGFGFHRQNLDLLSVLESIPFRDDVQALSTVFGIDKANLDQLLGSLQSVLRVNRNLIRIDLLDKKAGDMLREPRLKIMLAVG